MFAQVHKFSCRLIFQGFVSAQERLFQMDFGRRAAQGRLSEILGETTLSIDKMFRSFDFYGRCAGIFEQMSNTSQELISAYMEVNTT